AFDKPLGFADKPVGSGPYRFETRVGDTEVVLVRNEHHTWGRTPPFQKVRFVRSDEPVKDLLAGTVDLAPGLTADEALRVRDRKGAATLQPPGPNRRVYFLAVKDRKSTRLNSS